MVVTTRSRRGAAAPGLGPNELTHAHMASATPATGTSNSHSTTPADRRAPSERRVTPKPLGIPGAFSQSPTPQEPEPSSDEQEEDWVSDELTEAAEARIEGVLGNRSEPCPSEERIEDVGVDPTESCPSEDDANEQADQASELQSTYRTSSAGVTTSGRSRKAATGSRSTTPITPSLAGEINSHLRAFQTPSRTARVSPVSSTQGSIRGPKYFTNLLSIQYGDIHAEEEEERMEGGSDETLRQSKSRYKRKSEAQQHAEDMKFLREIINNNRRLQMVRASLPDMIPNGKSLLAEIAEMLPEAVSGDEYDWELKEPTPEAPEKPSSHGSSIKDATPPSIIEIAPTYFQKGKWVSNEEHDARVANKQAAVSKAKPKKPRPSMGITIDEVCPPKESPKPSNAANKTWDFGASINALPAGGYFAEKMRSRYEKPGNLTLTGKAKVRDSDQDSQNALDSVDNMSSSEDERSKHKREIRRLKEKLRKAKKAQVTPKDPTPYKGQEDIDVFEKWDFEVDRWVESHEITEKQAVEHICSFLEGKAAQWYIDFVAPEPDKYTVDSIKIGLFSYCFPPDMRARLRREFKYARQGNQKFVDYLRALKRYQRRLPDITDRQLCHKLWDTVHSYIKVKWIMENMDSEQTELEVLSAAAERYERAEDVARQVKVKQNSNGNRKGNHKGAYRDHQKQSDGTKTADSSETTKPADNVSKGESSKNGKKNKPKDKSKDNKPKIKLTKEKRDQLRAEGKCYMCEETGHTAKDCPKANTAKPSGLYSSAIQYAKIDELRKEREQTYLSVAAIRPFGSPSISENNSETPTAGDSLLMEILDEITPYSRIVVADNSSLRITSEKSDEFEITYKDIARRARDMYIDLTEEREKENQENNPMMILLSDPEDKEEVWEAIDWEDSDTEALPKISELQLNAIRAKKGKNGDQVNHIERNASKPKDITRKLPKPIIVEATINSHKVRALVDSGSLGDFISTTVVDQLKLPKETLANPIGLQMAVTGSRSIINYSVEAHLGLHSIDCMRRFDVINIDNYDLILGTPFLYQHKVLMSFNPPAISVGSSQPLTIAGDEAFVIEAHATQLYETEIEKCREELRRAGADLCKTMAETPLPPLRAINHTIPLIDETKRYRTRRVQCPKPLQGLWDEKFRAYLDTGRWEYRPGSNATPMLLLMKKSKDGKTALRTVLDKREINANTYKLASPLPDINDILTEVAKHPYKSLIDGKDAYEQIRIVPEHVERTLFMTPNGTMVSKVMQQGDCNAGATYQALMNHIFAEYIGKFMYVYLDDIIIFSDTAEDHMEHVKKVFEVLRKEKLYLSPNKMQLFADRLEILGHVITSEGIAMDPHKVDSIEKWKVPTNKEQLMSFLGAVGYLAPNCPNVRIPMAVLSKRAAPTQPWRWEATEQRAFQEIKDLVSEYRNHNRVAIDYSPGAPPINLTTDACCTGASGVLSQGDDPKTAKIIAFWSGKFTPTQQNYPVHEQELLAIKESLERFKHHIHGVHVRVYTDHKALVHFLAQKNQSPRQARWAEAMNNFDIEVIYIPGEENKVADALSRMYSNEPKGVVRAKSEYVDETDQETLHILVGATKIQSHLQPDITQPLYVGDEIRAELEKREEDVREPRRSTRDRKPVEKYSATAEETEAKQKKKKKRKSKKSKKQVKSETSGLETEAEKAQCKEFEPMDKSSNALKAKSDLTNCVTEAKLPECVIGRYTEDPMFKIIMEDPSRYSNFVVDQGALYLKRDGERLLCIPDIMIGQRKLREIVITHAHSILAHLGARKTIQWLRTQVWWKRMIKDVTDYCESCHTCAISKSSTQNPAGLLKPMPIPAYPWQSIGIDFVGPLPESETRYGKFDTIMTVIDNLTRMVHLIPTKSTYTAKDIAEVLWEHVIKLHGTPEIIVSDRDSLFTSDFWTRLAEITKTELKMSSAYHPQTDGMTERAQRTYVAILRICTGKKQNEWARHLPAIEFAINSARSEATGLAPFYLNYGRVPTPMILKGDDKFPGVKQHIENIKMAIMAAHDALIDARVKMTKQANEHRRPANFEVGELVYVSTKNMRLPKGLSRKLSNRYVGPYRISRVITEGASYEVEIGKDLRARGIHPVFHASLLRPHIPVDDIRFPGRNFEQIATLGEGPEEWAVEKIVSHRGKGRNADFEILWKSGDRTWEPYRIVRHLEALTRYCEAKGVPSTNKLPSAEREETKDRIKAELYSIRLYTGQAELNETTHPTSSPSIQSTMQSQPSTPSSDVHLTKEALEVIMNSQQRAQAESNNALIRTMEVAAGILGRNGGKNTHRKRIAKSRGPYQNPQTSPSQGPVNPGRRVKNRNKKKKNSNAPAQTPTVQISHQAGTNVEQTLIPPTTTALATDLGTDPFRPATEEEMLQLEQILAKEPEPAPQDIPVPAYSPSNQPIAPTQPFIPTQPTQTIPNPEPPATQAQQNPSTHIGVFPVPPPEETVDYEEDYAMEDQTQN